MIERNLERLKPEKQAVLEVASVAGPEFSVAAVAAALERPQKRDRGFLRAPITSSTEFFARVLRNIDYNPPSACAER